MPDNNVRIKLSADTSQAQKDIKLIDKQLKELGKEAGANGSKSEKSKEQGSAKGAGLGDLDTLINIDKQVLKVLNNMYRMNINPNSNRSIKYLAGRIDALGENLKGTSAGKSNGNNSKGATTGSAPQTNTPSTTSSNSGKSSGGDSGGDSFGSALKQAAGKLATATAVLSVLKGIASWVSEGAQKSASLESKAYMTYNSTRIFDNNFSSARNYAYGVGNLYGYGSEATMDFQDSYMARAGFTNKENLTSDTSSLMRVSKAYGIDLSNTGSVAGKYVQTGTFASGEQSKFANLLATSINEAGMTGRESEQLDVLESINDTLAQTLVTVSEDGQNNATALYSLLATTEDSLKGARGGSAIASINGAITGGGNSMDVLLGWGTTYTGSAGRWELEKRKAEGISNPDNLSKVFSNYERFTGQSINSAQGKLALQELLGIDPELVEVLVQNSESIKTGNYSDSFLSALESYGGDADVSGLIDNYNKSKVSTQEQYANAKENAQASTGDLWNSITSPFKNWFTGLTPGQQTGVTMGGMAAGGYAGAKGAKWATNKGSKLFGRWFGKGTEATGDVADAAKATGNSADDILKGATSGLDDAAKAAGNSLDDIAKAAGNSADDVAKAVGGFSKAGSALGKLGKAAGWIGIALEVISTGIDTKDALDRDDGRTAASEIGEGVGSIGGGAGGAAAGAAIGSFIAPGIGTAIGGIIGGIIGGFGGAAAGKAAGEGIYDATTDKKELTDEQKKQIKAYYNEVSSLYEKEGNNVAQDYTLQTVVPYLNSIGISTSITDKYKTDTGKPDFMKDYENDVFFQTPNVGGGKFKLGLDYVPYDEFKATLHQGEAVLTADEAKKWRERNSIDSINSSISVPQSSGSTYTGTNLLEIKLSGAVDGMTYENQHIIVQAVIQQLGLSKSPVLGNLGNSFVRTPN